MANQNRRSFGKPEFETYPVSASKTTAIYVGDMVWWDESNNVAVSAADFTYGASEADTQAKFARVFLGVAMDASALLASDPIRVSKECAARMDCASATIEADEYVCPEKASGNALEPQKLQTTTDPNAAIGKAMSRGSAQTTILAHLKGIVGAAAHPELKVARKRQVALGNVTAYTVSAADHGCRLTTSGVTAACTLTFPAPAAALAGVEIEIFNYVGQTLVLTGTANKIITFNDVDADAVTYSSAGELIGAHAIMSCDGAMWMHTNLGAHTATVTT